MQRPRTRPVLRQPARHSNENGQRRRGRGGGKSGHEPRRFRRQGHAPRVPEGWRPRLIARLVRPARTWPGREKPPKWPQCVKGCLRCRRIAILSKSIIALEKAVGGAPRKPEAQGQQGCRNLSRFSNRGGPPCLLNGLYLASRMAGLAQWRQLLDICEKVFRRQAQKLQPVSLPILSVRGEIS